MKNKSNFSVWGALALIIVAFLGIQLANTSPARAANTNADSPTREITVVGQATVLAKPDIAIAEIGVQVTAPSVGQATKESNDKMAALIAKLKELGIADKDIQTSNYSIFPQQNPQNTGTGEITDYQVANSVQVTIRDLNKIGEFLDQAVQAGANNISGVSFSLVSTISDHLASFLRSAVRQIIALASTVSENAVFGGTLRKDAHIARF